MKTLDCTLRDGGHAVDFDWPILMARDYYKLMLDIGVDVMELGYWGQTSKSKNTFYNLDQQKVELFAGEEGTCSVMVDYHYCSHNLSHFPKKGNGVVDMIRVCSRKQDIPQAMRFANDLKAYTGLLVSLNVFNFSNYTDRELVMLPSALKGLETDYIYFADTHGAMDLEDLHNPWNEQMLHLIQTLRHKREVGIHLHDHLGKAYSNYIMADYMGASMADSTLFGIGKGAGNLHTEHIINPEHLPQVLRFIERWHEHLSRPYNPYYAITAAHSVCEAYAVQANEARMTLKEFDTLCSEMSDKDRDVYDKCLI